MLRTMFGWVGGLAIIRLGAPSLESSLSNDNYSHGSR